jgi:hypothetical protein
MAMSKFHGQFFVVNRPRYGCYSQVRIAIQLDRYQKDSEGFRRIRGLSDGLTRGRQVSFLCLYMTRLALYFLGRKQAVLPIFT